METNSLKVELDSFPSRIRIPVSRRKLKPRHTTVRRRHRRTRDLDRQRRKAAELLRRVRQLHRAHPRRVEHKGPIGVLFGRNREIERYDVIAAVPLRMVVIFLIAARTHHRARKP